MADRIAPPFSGNINFNAHHSPVGAYFSFICGHFGSRGGLGVQLGRPADQDVFIGVKQGDRASAAPLRCLPFFREASDPDPALSPDAAACASDAPPPLASDPSGVTACDRADIARHYGWATDRWVTPELEFTIHTPFSGLFEPSAASADEMRLQLLPAVLAELEVDNRSGTDPKTVVFALGFHEPGARLLDDRPGWVGRRGFALRGHTGVMGQLIDPDAGAGAVESVAPGDLFSLMGSSPDAAMRMPDPNHLLGRCAGLGFEVRPGERRTLRLALGVFLDGIVTTRLEGRYFYTRYFASLEGVLSAGLDQFDARKILCAARDRSLLSSGLSPNQQFLLAHATRSYYGCTQLLSVGGQPHWIVNDGESCMMNPIDVSADVAFWELRQNPWVVRNRLDAYVRYYAYTDRVRRPGGKLHPGGLSFCHDQGAHNNFAAFGHSAYELPHRKGQFSHMTQEALCDWVLMAASYVMHTADRDWLRQNEYVLDACLRSMQARDHPVPEKYNGVMRYDSSRCGDDGQEVTAYDTLDASLSQARNSLYLAGKCWAAYLGLELLYNQLGRYSEAAEEGARFASATIAGQMRRSDGYVSAVFEKDSPAHAARILPAVEGLVFPLYWRSCQPADEVASEALSELGDHRSMLQVLRQHANSLLNDPQNRNRFPDGGLRLSSASDCSWISKIALFQHVVREVFHLEDASQRAAADAAHVKWLTEGGAAYWAMSDQIVNGAATASRGSPRGVTAALWLKGT